MCPFEVKILPRIAKNNMSVKSKFCHSLMYTNCYIATQFTQFSTTSNSHKMPYKRHFITFSVFGVSIKSKVLICASTIAI